MDGMLTGTPASTPASACRATPRAFDIAIDTPAARAGPAERSPARTPWARWTCAAGLVLAIAPAGAQSLNRLHDVARGYDATYLAARLQADATEQRLAVSRALTRPSVSASVGTVASHARTPWSSTTTSTSRESSAGIHVEVPVYNRSHQQTQSQAELQVGLARSQLAAAEQDLMMRLSQAYFDVLAAADALSAVQTGRAAIAEQVASAQKAFEVGSVTITDTREAEARLDLVRAQELAAEHELDTARRALDQLVGRRQLQPWILAQPSQPPQLDPPDAELWVQQADEHNPTLQQLRLARELARLDTGKARSAALPTVSATASLQWVQGRLEGRNRVGSSTLAFGPHSGNGPSASVGLQLSVPLYAGGAIQNHLKETLTLEDKAEAEWLAARRILEQTVRTGVQGVASLRARVQALDAAEASSRLALEATQTGYEVGVRVSLDVLNAQTQLIQAQRERAQARYDLILTLLRLRQTAGVLGAEDLAGVSWLLQAP